MTTSPNARKAEGGMSSSPRRSARTLPRAVTRTSDTSPRAFPEAVYAFLPMGECKRGVRSASSGERKAKVSSSTTASERAPTASAGSRASPSARDIIKYTIFRQFSSKYTSLTLPSKEQSERHITSAPSRRESSCIFHLRNRLCPHFGTYAAFAQKEGIYGAKIIYYKPSYACKRKRR